MINALSNDNACLSCYKAQLLLASYLKTIETHFYRKLQECKSLSDARERGCVARNPLNSYKRAGWGGWRKNTLPQKLQTRSPSATGPSGADKTNKRRYFSSVTGLIGKLVCCGRNVEEMKSLDTFYESLMISYIHFRWLILKLLKRVVIIITVPREWC